jgi:hypothetical protein
LAESRPEYRPALALAQSSLARLEWLVGNPEQADRLYQSAVANARDASHPDPGSNYVVLTEYAAFLRETDRKSEAQRLIRQAQSFQKMTTRPESSLLTVDVSELRAK